MQLVSSIATSHAYMPGRDQQVWFMIIHMHTGAIRNIEEIHHPEVATCALCQVHAVNAPALTFI